MNQEPVSQSDAEETTRRRSPAWRWVLRVVIAVGLAWVITILMRDFEALRADFRIASVGWLLFTMLVGVVALLFLVPVFRLLLSTHSGLHIGYLGAARMLFVAQILRHLPGRIWGIAYLVAETRLQIPSTATVRANIDTMVYSMYFSLLVAATLFLGVEAGPVPAVAAAVVGIGLLAVVVRYDWLGRAIRTAARMLPNRIAKLVDGLPLKQVMSWSHVLLIVGFTGLSWACYLLIWWSFVHVFPALSDINIWLLCAAYCAAWFVGYVSLVTPSGVGVREASFFVFAGTLTTLPNLAFLAVFVRVWQVIAEIVVFLMFAFVKPGIGDKDAMQVD